jgi:hypothetical protein
MIRFLTLFCFFCSSVFAFDLRIANVTGALLSHDAEGMTASFEIFNDGPEAATGTIRLQPFLVPQVDLSAVNGFKPVVLKNGMIQINIAAGSSQIVSYNTNDLPLIPQGVYSLGAFFQHTSVAEASIANNVTNDLSFFGPFSHVATSPLDANSDIYSDVRASYSAINGRISHQWRLSWRGPQGGQIRVIFFIYSPELNKVYPSTYEKPVGWVNMGRDWDVRSRLVNYDVYSQAPDFNNAKAGNLFLFSWVNYHQGATEQDYSNNIDARKFYASYVSSKSSIEVWKTYIDEQPTPGAWTLPLGSQYSSAQTWSLVRGSLPDQVTSPQMSGATAPSYQVVLQNDGFSVDEGTTRYEGSVKVTNASGVEVENKALNLVVSRYNAGNQPVIEIPAQVSVSAVSPNAPQPYAYVIRNTGSSPLEFKLQKNNDWMFFSNDSGVVAPGAETTVMISFSGNGIDTGTVVGSFVVHNNSIDNQKVVNVSYVDQAPTR